MVGDMLRRSADAVSAVSDVPAMPAIRISNLNFAIGTRGNAEGLCILDDINLEVGEGEFVALVGTSGCGKSTLLNMISGMYHPSSGEVSVFGTPVTGIPKRVGYMFQTDSLLPWRRVIRNVEMGLELAGVAAGERRERAMRQLAELGLGGFENHWPSELSGGMRQRAALARTWLTNPDILLMDEPFGALDSQTRLMIQESFLAVWEKRKQSVVLVTHDIEEAIAMADRVIVMSARPGRIKSVYQIELKRPRSLIALRSDDKFHTYWQSIWADLEEGARRSFATDTTA
jgi:NitT/TauT family transport system ATP-binding protein